MDGGFRKLWARTRKKSNTSVQRATPVNDGPTYDSRPSMAITDGRPSMTGSSNMLESSPSQDRMGSSRDYASVTSDEYIQPKPGHRIQPILVGISRPVQYSDRPTTAGSMQYSAQPATNTDGRKSSELLSNQAMTPSYHKKLNSPRYVDIFAVASSVPAYKSRFNEEIAERNLDVLKMAMEEQSDYVPLSKYQEEVANRNADPRYVARASNDYGSRLTGINGYVTSPNRAGQQADVAQRNGYHKQFLNDSSLPNRTTHDALARYTQSPTLRTHNAEAEPSAAMYGRYFESDERPIQLNTDLGPSTPRSFGNSPSRDHTYTQPGMHTIPERSGSRQHLTSDESSSGLRRTGTGGSSSRDGYIEYTLSASELEGRAQSRQPPLRSIDTGAVSERRYMDQYIRAPSATSTRSHKRAINLQNRTIMDLTGEDDGVSESSSTYGSENTPVIEQAKWNSIQRVVPSHADSYSRITSTETTPTNTSDEREKSPRLPHIEQTQPLIQSDKKPALQPLKIAFSPISTLASVTPRASVILSNQQPLTMVQRVTAALEARSAGSDTQISQVPQVPKALSKKTSKSSDLQSDGTRSGEVTPKAEAMNSSSAANYVPVLEPLDQSTIPVTATPTSGVKAVSQEQKRSTTPLRQTTPSIYESPKSLNSVDYKSPSEPFGVLTRDFAVTPKKSAASLKKTEARSLQKSATENAAKAASQSQKKTSGTCSTSRAKQRTPTIKKVPSGGFDEEAFARKQAEARAALERLQLSLKEDFMTLPSREPSKNRVSYGSDTEGRSVAPASTSSISRAANRSSSGSQKTDQEGPPSSYRRPSHEPTRVSSMSSTRSRSTGGTPRKSAPPSLKNIEAASALIDATTLPPSLLHVLETTSKPPRSPGEISLSSFPLPTSRPTSEHEPINGVPVTSSMPNHSRRNSTKSQASIASQFSIPFHMIPDRSSSVRETVAEEDEEGYTI